MTDGKTYEGQNPDTEPGDWEHIDNAYEGEYWQRFACAVPQWGAKFVVEEDEWTTTTGGDRMRTIRRLRIVS